MIKTVVVAKILHERNNRSAHFCMYGYARHTMCASATPAIQCALRLFHLFTNETTKINYQFLNELRFYLIDYHFSVRLLLQLMIHFYDRFSVLKPPVTFYISGRSKAVLLVWFSVFACFGVIFCTVFTFFVSR